MFLRACASALRVVSSGGLALATRQQNSRLVPIMEHARAFCSGKPVIFSIETADEFEEHVLNSEVPVVVDFHADWCGPCQMLGPRLEEKISGRGGQVLMAKVNIDAAGELAMDWNVNAVPTVLAFHNGEVVTGFQGVVEDEQLDEFIDKCIEG